MDSKGEIPQEWLDRAKKSKAEAKKRPHWAAIFGVNDDVEETQAGDVSSGTLKDPGRLTLADKFKLAGKK